MKVSTRQMPALIGHVRVALSSVVSVVQSGYNNS